MKAKELKKFYGDEYPAAVVVDGVRMPLTREGRFSRSYNSTERKMGSEISRFMDGSASITAMQLQCEWSTWTERVRIEFCQSCGWLHEQPDFPDMLRFIMQHAGPGEWSGIASSVALRLPQDEAFDILLRALRTTDIGRTANITQAIAMTKHPDAEVALRKHLEAVFAHQSLCNDDQFINYVAFDATTCVAHLIELGASPSEFDKQVHLLSEHICSRNRDSCRNFLSKHYSWLK